MRAIATQGNSTTPAARNLHATESNRGASKSVASINTYAPPLLQRVAACACGGGCPACTEDAPGENIQTKLRVSTHGDPYEQEADRAADQIMRMPDSEFEKQAKRPADKSARNSREVAPALIHRSAKSAIGNVASDFTRLLGNGSPLDPESRRYFEPRFGYDFANVRIHSGPDAAMAADSVRARAFTLGRDVVFGAGEHDPGSARGRHLLAHELAHVVQQDEGRSEGLVQRAEVDDRSCAGLTDAEADVDTEVNNQLTAARASVGTPMVVPEFLYEVASRLGGFQPYSPIERFMDGLGPTKVSIPPDNLAGTKFAGAKGDYQLQKALRVVGSKSLVHGVCVGADKLGHFFEEGYIYHSGFPATGGGPPADPEKLGRGLEINIFGLTTTGVYSNADLEANRAGLQFFKDLEANPSLTFAISHYITSMWNEQANPSFYEADLAGVIWSNLLTGTWNGPFTSGAGSGSVQSMVDLSATATGATGTYEWPAGGAQPNRGQIKNGVITQRTTTVSGRIPLIGNVTASPVSGISIDYDWEEGTTTGKGKWESIDEQTLEGTWGYGASATDGGTWTLQRGTPAVVPPVTPSPAQIKIVNKENTWLVDDPRHWQEPAHRLATLPLAAPVEVLDEGAGESFNQTTPEFRWWKVKAGGTEGWVMQSLLDSP